MRKVQVTTDVVPLKWVTVVESSRGPFKLLDRATEPVGMTVRDHSTEFEAADDLLRVGISHHDYDFGMFRNFTRFI